MLTKAQLSEARDWINDCEWMDVVDATELSDRAVELGVERHYSDGLDGFIRDFS